MIHCGCIPGVVVTSPTQGCLQQSHTAVLSNHQQPLQRCSDTALLNTVRDPGSNPACCRPGLSSDTVFFSAAAAAAAATAAATATAAAAAYLHEGCLSGGLQLGSCSIHTAGHRLGQLPHNAAQRLISTSILLLKQLACIKQ